MLILRHDDVRAALEGQEQAVLDAVRGAYLAHTRGLTALPHSVFLRFPGEAADRIIALPAFLGGTEAVAGMKWVSSFPANVPEGLARASAVMVLNSPRTGLPETVLEASLISARRTAASAALAARLLPGGGPDETVALIGCGTINFEVLRFLRHVFPGLPAVILADTDRGRRQSFADRCAGTWPELKITQAGHPREALEATSLVSIATTATRPHLTIDGCLPGTLVLHISLRDLTPGAILACHNVVDDVDHVCRERTSVHLAEQLAGHRGFLGPTIGSLLEGATGGRIADGVTVFSPFGLGVLDLAVARLVRERAGEAGSGVPVPGFSP